MKSDTPKVLHKISGKPMLYYSIKEALKLSDDITVVLYHQFEKVKTEINAAKKSFEDSISQAIAGVLTVKAGELSAKKEKVQNV